MEYQKIINLLWNNTITHIFKLKTNNWVKINHDKSGPYSTSSQIKLKKCQIRVYVVTMMYAYLLKEP